LPPEVHPVAAAPGCPAELDDARGERGDELAIVRDEHDGPVYWSARCDDSIDSMSRWLVGLIRQHHVRHAKDEVADVHALPLAA